MDAGGLSHVQVVHASCCHRLPSGINVPLMARQNGSGVGGSFGLVVVSSVVTTGVFFVTTGVYVTSGDFVIGVFVTPVVVVRCGVDTLCVCVVVGSSGHALGSSINA